MGGIGVTAPARLDYLFRIVLRQSRFSHFKLPRDSGGQIDWFHYRMSFVINLLATNVHSKAVGLIAIARKSSSTILFL